MPPPNVLRPSRESVTTIRADGSRSMLYPADVRGRFDQARKLAALGLIVFYLSLPWITINGHPAVFLDLAGLRFHLFGLTFAAQDLWLFFFVITGLGFSLFFVTALFGRVWCGWACPHTVFLDHVFRRIERWMEGDAVRRRALRDSPLTAGKLAKRIGKHGLYVLAAATITHLLLAYFVSLPEVWTMMRTDPARHWGAFVFMVVATGALYFNFAWFREQLCIVICPYGRIQSALIDDHSLVIGYDAARGEPRGKQRAALDSAAAKPGDCIDCNRCVQVCPTGIDIRQGLQMECVGCTACIDACDEVMDRVQRPRGLIRYDSQKAFGGERTRWIRPRTLLYFGLLLVGAAVVTWSLSTLRPASLGVTRMIGAPYVIDAGTVRNQFLVRLVNKRNAPVRFSLAISGAPAGVRVVGFDDQVEVGPLGELVHPLVLQQARADYGGPFHFVVTVRDGAEKSLLTRAVEFLGPEARLLREEEKEQRERP
ncbi:MAG: cytochrome c oxidase accessory protein CcoG [Opitutaceae bacterium]